MTSPAHAHAAHPHPSALSAKLAARIRPEFRSDVLRVSGPAFYPGVHGCAVTNCQRPTVANGLCNAHRARWQRHGRPDLEEWAKTTPGWLVGRGQVKGCLVPGCEFAHSQGEFCERHFVRWKRSGESPAEWAPQQDPLIEVQAEYPVCAIPWCTYRASGTTAFCRPHRTRWERHKKPEVSSYIRDLVEGGVPTIDLRALPSPLRLEVQYGLQERIDAKTFRTRGSVINPAVRVLRDLEIRSVLDLPFEDYDAAVAQSAIRDAGLAFLRHLWHLIDRVDAGEGWSGQYPRDRWDLRALGLGEPQQVRFIDFSRISQPWLRELAKRFIRWRLSVEVSLPQVTRDLLALQQLSEACDSHTDPPQAVSELKREHLEAFLSLVRDRYPRQQTRRLAIGSIGVFLTALRQQGWDETLPSTTALFKEDLGRYQRERLPRAVDEHVMRQVESRENMARWKDPEDRLIAELLIRTGRRLGEAVSLRTDCVLRDSATGDPYLRYTNHKMRREAYAPLDEELASAIEAQQARVRSRWPTGDRALFPKHKSNPEGTIGRPGAVFRSRLYSWLADCDIRDQDGNPVHLTPHQWRHTFATRLVEADVSIEVVRRLLDHESIEMSGHYARVRLQRAKEEWDRVRKIDARGRGITLDPREELGTPAYLAHAVNQSRHALSNGHCRLTAQQPCEHVNPCLSCPMFFTTAEFLPEHRAHRGRVQLQLIANTREGRTRAAEKNEQDLKQLDRIIEALEEPDPDGAPSASQEGDSRLEQA